MSDTDTADSQDGLDSVSDGSATSPDDAEEQAAVAGDETEEQAASEEEQAPAEVEQAPAEIESKPEIVSEVAAEDVAAKLDSSSSLRAKNGSVGEDARAREAGPSASAEVPAEVSLEDVSLRADHADTAEPTVFGAAATTTATMGAETTSAPAAAVFAPTTVAVQSPLHSLLELPRALIRGTINAVVSFFEPIVGPGAPADNGLLWGLLAWVRREANNQTPTISYNAAQTSQLNGGLFGSVAVGDANNDDLSLTVTRGPAHGTVTVNQDGTFRYIPNPQSLVAGGPDSFVVTVSDRQGPANVLSDVAGFLFGQPHTAKVTVTLDVAGQTSPLVTEEQLSQEQRAMQMLNSGALDQAMAAMRAKMLELQQATFADAGGIDAANMALLDEAVNEFAMFAAMAAANIADSYGGNPAFQWSITPPHTLAGQAADGTRILSDNPDTLYRSAFVNPRATTYVINGKVNGQMPTDTVFTVQIDGASGDQIVGEDLQVNPDGTFTIIAGRDVSRIDEPNYLYLDPGASVIFSRNTIKDWNTEQALTLSIEQVEGGTIPLPLGAAIGIAMQTMQSGADELVPAWFSLAAKTPVNELTPPSSQSTIGLNTQMQSAGHFQLADNEAMVVTIHPGTAEYFSLPVYNDWTVSPDYLSTPTSLNNSQAIANPDGTYTFVVSRTDPGLANWVSTGGLNQGTIYARFQQLNPDSTDHPTVTTQVVTLDQLNSVLPSTIAYFTPEQRAQQMAERRSGYTLRTAPYISTDITPDSVQM